MTEIETYFDFKDNIKRSEQLFLDRINFVEIYMKQSLEKIDKLEAQIIHYENKLNTHIKEIEEFNVWYCRQNFFKKIWWNIKKLDYQQLKNIKNGII